MNVNFPILDIVPSFLSEVECNYLMSFSKKYFKKSEVSHGDASMEIKEERHSESAFLLDQFEDEKISKIKEKIADYTNTSINNQEIIQVTKYTSGGYYKAHYDHSESLYQNDISRLAGPRVLTCLIYLNDKFKGGETIFPKMGVKLTPRVGTMIVFKNVDLEDCVIDYSLHSANPIENGEKWVCNQWIRKFDPYN